MAIVTGGASGIGYACAEVSADNGARVRIVDPVTEKLSQAEELLTRAADVTKLEQMERVAASTIERFGPDVNRYFEAKGQSSNRSLQYFHVLHSSICPARMRCRDQSVLQVTLYAHASETSGCQALLICQRPRLSPPSPVASG